MAAAPVRARFNDEPSRQSKIGFSTVKETLRSGYDSRIASRECTSSQNAGADDDSTVIDEGPGPSIYEGRTAVKPATSYTAPLIVSSPMIGSVPSDSEDDPVTPTEETPADKVSPTTSRPVVTGPLVQPTKGPAGITLLPAYQNNTAKQATTAANAFISSGLEQKPYPPPPCAKGSPNDRFRQVPRSGGGVRKPDFQPQPFKYPYAPQYQQLGVNALQSAYQQQYNHFPQQTGIAAQFNSSAGSFNQSGNFQNQNYAQVQPYQQPPPESHSSPRGSYRGRGRVKYDVRKARGDHKVNDNEGFGNGNSDVASRCGDYSTPGSHYNHRTQYGSGGQYKNTNGKRNAGYGKLQPNSPGFPLDPALEANYRNYTAQSQNQYSNSGNNGHYPAQSYGQVHPQYPASPDFGYGAVPNYNNDYGQGHPQYVNNSNYYTSIALSHPGHQSNGGPTIAHQQQQGPPSAFHPSPYAAEFTPRSMEISRLLNPDPEPAPSAVNPATQQSSQHHTQAQQSSEDRAPAQSDTLTIIDLKSMDEDVTQAHEFAENSAPAQSNSTIDLTSTDNTATQQSIQHHAPAQPDSIMEDSTNNEAAQPQKSAKNCSPSPRTIALLKGSPGSDTETDLTMFHHNPIGGTYAKPPELPTHPLPNMGMDIDITKLNNPIGTRRTGVPATSVAPGKTTQPTLQAPAGMAPLASAYLSTSSTNLYAITPELVTKPIVTMPPKGPPMGMFSPPKSRKDSKAKEVLEKVEVVGGRVKLKINPPKAEENKENTQPGPRGDAVIVSSDAEEADEDVSGTYGKPEAKKKGNKGGRNEQRRKKALNAAALAAAQAQAKENMKAEADGELEMSSSNVPSSEVEEDVRMVEG